jgi:DNA-binding NarL/FixJ family response regulator
MTRNCFACGQPFEGGAAERKCQACRVIRGRRPVTPELTLREIQIIARIGKGMQNKQIAFELSLTTGSIKEYMNRIFRKLRARGIPITNRTELAVWHMQEQQRAP